MAGLTESTVEEAALAWLEADGWLAVNQFAVVEKGSHRGLPQQHRPDVVLFLNGLPLGVLELKNAANLSISRHPDLHIADTQTYD